LLRFQLQLFFKTRNVISLHTVRSVKWKSSMLLVASRLGHLDPFSARPSFSVFESAEQEGIMERTKAVKNEGAFRVSCDAGKVGQFQADTDSLWVRVGQRVRRRSTEEMWDSVAIESTVQQDGTLVLRVLVFNPDWDEPLQIASIRSRPHDPECLTALGCNLDHVTL
jgi:hypothetical protein